VGLLGEQFAVASVIAMCAVTMVCGVVSMNGNAAPGASPSSIELAAMKLRSSVLAEAWRTGSAKSSTRIERVPAAMSNLLRRIVCSFSRSIAAAMLANHATGGTVAFSAGGINGWQRINV